MNLIIRFFIVLIIINLSVGNLMAQATARDVVYLKNGSIIKGSIIEMIPDQSIKIQTGDGSIFVYAMSEVEKISKETLQSSGTASIFGGTNQGSSSRFSIFGGAALPMGDFAKELSADNFASSNSINDLNASAKTGFVVGAQFVTGGTIGWIINCSYSQTRMEAPSSLDVSGNSFKLETSNWSSILALTGVKIGTDNTSGVNFFVAPLIGVLFGKSAEFSLDYSYYFNFSSFNYSFDVLENFASASSTALAYGGQAELVIADHITIGAQYIYSKPEYDIDVSAVLSGSISSSESKKMAKTQKTSVLMLYAGFAF